MAISINRITSDTIRVIEERSTWGTIPMYEVRLVDETVGINVMLALIDSPEEAHALVEALELGSLIHRTGAALFAARRSSECCCARIDHHVCTQKIAHGGFHRDERTGMEWRYG